MLKFVHHVEYFVRDLDEMVAYMERSFEMKPEKLFDDQEGRFKEAQYRVGPTIIRFREPTPGTPHAQSMEKNGPGLKDVAWGVDSISRAAQQLKAKGITLPDELHPHRSSRGFHMFTMDPKDSLGIPFQLVEESK